MIIDSRPKKIRNIILVAAAFLAVAFLLWFFWSNGYLQGNSTPQNTGKNSRSDSDLQKTEPFKHYKFGSVKVALSNGVRQTVSGSSILIESEITNNNDYPIVDGNLYIKLYRKQAQGETGNVDYFKNIPDEKVLNNADYLVDQWNALEDISLNPKETKKLGFSYQTSAFLPEGEYYFAAYFQVAKKFNLLGLPFTEDVMGEKLEIAVKNPDISGAVEFEKNEVKINNEKYNFVGFMRSYPEDKVVVLNAPLKNTTKDSQRIIVSGDVYYWDNQDGKNKIDHFQENITLGPDESKNLEYKIKANSFPVNYVVLEASQSETKSILNIRFARTSQALARINFQGLSTFPFVKDEQNKLFLTAHAVMQQPFIEPSVDQGKQAEMPEYTISAVLRDKDQKIINQTHYAGPITGEVMGFEKNFASGNDYDYATLTTEIKDPEGKLIDAASTVYDCQKMDAAICSGGVQAGGESRNLQSRSMLVNMALFLLVLLLAGGAFLLLRSRKNVSRSILFFLVSSIFLFGLFFTGAGETQAKSVTFAQPAIESMIYKHPRFFAEQNFYWLSVWNISGSIRYSSQAIDNVGASLESETSLEPGSVFYVEDRTHADANAITWNLTGFGFDTPPGYWRDDVNLASIDSYSPQANDLIVDYPWASDAIWREYFPQMFDPPVISLTASGPVDCIQENAYRWLCVVRNQSGQINLSLNYAPTYGYHFYYAKFSSPDNIYKGALQTKISCNNSLGLESFWQPRGVYNTCSDNVSAVNAAGSTDCVECGGDRKIDVPAQAIPYTFDVESSAGFSSPISSPFCQNCPSTLPVGELGNFNIGGSTGDYDPNVGYPDVKYVVDWMGMDGIPEAESPFGLPDGSHFYNFTKSWATPQTVNYQFKAVDNSGNSSDWVPGSIVVTEAIPNRHIEFVPSSKLVQEGTSGPLGVLPVGVLQLTPESDIDPTGQACGNINITQDSGPENGASLLPSTFSELPKSLTYSASEINEAAQSYHFTASSENCGNAVISLDVLNTCKVLVSPQEITVFPGRTVTLSASTDFAASPIQWSVASGLEYIETTSQNDNILNLTIKNDPSVAMKTVKIQAYNICGRSPDAIIHISRPGWTETE